MLISTFILGCLLILPAGILNEILIGENNNYDFLAGFTEETLKFFVVHQHADKWHREVVKKLLGEICDDDAKKEEALDAIDQALFSLNNFLTGMERVYC